MQSTVEKLSILGSSAKYDICASTSVNASRLRGHFSGQFGSRLPSGCCHVYTSDGRCVALFKVLLTNACTNDCFYCQNSTSCSRGKKKVNFSADELIGIFLEFYKRNYIEGLFLSSGICGSTGSTVEKMIEIASKLRNDHGFGGYMHLKVLPSTSLSDIKELGRYADRLSLNVEAPGKSHLNEICTTKNYSTDILTRLGWMHAYNKREKLPAGLTTQVIVGGNDASDHDILKSAGSWYSHFGLKRVYYSAFSPISGTPLQDHSATPRMREHRLYQADWLFRVYKFPLKDILPGKGENLSLGVDPKLGYAIHHYPEHFPLDINESSYRELLRVPGIGPKSARRIVSFRKNGRKIVKESTLRSLGVVMARARPFLIINGHRYSRLDDWFPKHGMEISA
ncbi:MAG: putative DNA modification/repair radical SAM protein [Promethearchaeota archaeon]